MDIQARMLRRLQCLYGDEAASVAARIRQRVDDHRTRRAVAPRDPDRVGDWDERDAVLIAYGNSIEAPGQAPLQTLKTFVDERFQGAVNVLHVLSFFPSSSDDGFAVIDYREVDETLGDWRDIHALREHFDLMIDWVLNHCSRRSLWFSDYISDFPPYNRYFVEAKPDDDLALVVRPRSTPLLWKVRTHRGDRYVWGTFSDDQMDLDYRNPKVLLEMLDILLFYVRAGMRIVRLDAVAYLWKRVGATCIHLPETHEIVKLARDVLRLAAPNTLLLTETNVPYAENRSYFGQVETWPDGKTRTDEAQLIYQFSLPPLLLHALHTGDATYLTRWAQAMEADPPPPGCAYMNLTASHDGVGLRGLEGLVPEKEIVTLLDAMRQRGGFVSMRRREDGVEVPYELNISYFEAFRDPGLERDPWVTSCFLVSQLTAMSLRGIPVLYIHSFTATPNDHYGVEQTGRTRRINRRRWDWDELQALLDNPETEQSRVFHALVHALKIRREHAAFHPDGPQRTLNLGPHLFGLTRVAPDGGDHVICLFNFTPDLRPIPVDAACFGLDVNIDGEWMDLLSGQRPVIERGRIHLSGYCALWLHRANR